ncbi:MAG: hypothetical protein M1827_000689 [Pycnora praestabilis]|nr:MAG: hypothetical protein M1827_000689 [Pycnora praestabilis]
MSKTVHIGSTAQFTSLISSSTIVVTDFYADWCGPCKQIAPMYEQLSSQLSRPNKITFAKVNVDQQQEIAQTYGITAMPTFMIFKNAKVVSTVRGADPRKLSEVVKKLAAEAGSNGSSSSGGFGEASGSGGGIWFGASLPKGYTDITDQVDVKGLDLLNSDSEFGNARTLFDTSKPSGLASAEVSKGKGKSGETEKRPDWLESDTDEQLMLYMPFQSTLKVHTIHITSLPPKADEDDDSEIPMRPKTIQIYSNRAHVLGFEEAEDIPATQSVTLTSRDWDAKTGTAKIELRFVKFQNVTSLVVFVVDGDGDGEKVRVDRLRIVGETGEKRELGKLEKIGDEQGE